ncbi:MAG: aminotransferase class I/II-fold pyridoxal phosphate-dependent enzyme [Clostridiales bacterium]|nr:aminotransferase class I/II-fold pyridoxal phosphate-dependent enzyme [Clostridiales bacterium]
MRSFDFESIIDRTGMDAMAVDALGKLEGFSPQPPEEGFDPIPMWVADMNFKVPECITDAVRKRLDHPLFGYFLTRDEYYQSIINWHRTRNGVTGLTKEHIGYENGVLGGLVSVLNALLEPGDKVLLHDPTYVGFTGSITNAGYEIVHSRLIRDEDSVWRMDYDDMDRKIREHGIKVCVFCNPHNPCGRVWTREEIEKAAAVYEKNGCTVISDEIWSDILLDGRKYTPFQSVSRYAAENTVALYAPSKTFNLAGLIGSYHIIYNEELRKQVDAAGSRSHYNNMNVLSMHALIGAYSEEGMAWTDALCKVLSDNVDYACGRIEKEFTDLRVSRPQGTYMLFIDCSEWCRRTGKTFEDLLRSGWRVGVAWQDGRPFRKGDYIRMNLALPLSRIEEAFDRIAEYVY